MRQPDPLQAKPLAELQAAYDAQVRRTSELAKAGQFATMPLEQQLLQRLKRAIGSVRQITKNDGP